MNAFVRGFSFAAAALLLSSALWATGAGSAAGLTLMRNGGARSSALGEAFVSMSNDITAMEFNPASLSTLDSGQASLQYERGIFEDSFSKAMVGVGTRSSGVFGFSLGYYNSGKANLYDGVTQKSVTAEQDKVATLGWGFERARFQWGANVRYFSSALAESESASATSLDLGAQRQLMTHLRIGASGPVIQSKLNYGNTNASLPKVYRAGVGWATNLPLATGNLPLQLLMDIPYDANERVTSLAFGAETQIGVLALRMGFNTQSDIQQFSIGAGFQFARMNLDYSFGMVDNSNINSLHKITFSFRFDDPRARSSAGAAALSSTVKPSPWLLNVSPTKDPTPSVATEEEKVQKFKTLQSDGKIDYRYYEVKDGETLESIALKRYGSASHWNEIFAANRHMYSTPEEIKPGSRILLPVSVDKAP